MLEITVTKTENKRIVPPMFWREQTGPAYEYLGLLNDKTVVKVFMTPDIVTVQNSYPEKLLTTIQRACGSWIGIDEDEFFSAYDEAMDHLRLTPELRERAGEYKEREPKEKFIPAENGSI